MSTPRGVFDSFPNPSSPSSTPSPFSIAPEKAASSPFSVAPDSSAPAPSPFSVVPDEKSAAPSPFTTAPSQSEDSDWWHRYTAKQSPFAAAASSQGQTKKDSPYTVVNEQENTQDPRKLRAQDRRRSNDPAPQAAEAQGFGFEIPSAAPAAAPKPSPFEAVASAEPAPFATAATEKDFQSSDSFQIRQLELRAIFGVGREMSKDEILQRARSLTGVRDITRLSEGEIATVEAFKTVIANLGFGPGALKLHLGSSPIEFIREGRTLLAVQTEGGFAPGVRETLMIVARELGRL